MGMIGGVPVGMQVPGLGRVATGTHATLKPNAGPLRGQQASMLALPSAQARSPLGVVCQPNTALEPGAF